MGRPSSNDLPLVDSHLEPAENTTLFGRDLTLGVAKIRSLERRTTKQATVSLPELERGDIAVAFATVTRGSPRFEGRYSHELAETPSDLRCRKPRNGSLAGD